MSIRIRGTQYKHRYRPGGVSIFNFPGAIGTDICIVSDDFNFVGILFADKVRKNGADYRCHPAGNDDNGYIICLAPGVKVFESNV